MAKAIWAVACVTLVAGILLLGAPGCASTPGKPPGAASGAAPGPEVASGAPAPSEGSPASREAGAEPSGPAPGSSPAAAAPKAEDLSGPRYRIGQEDVLHVSVWDNKELTLDVVVRPDGKISLPLVQDVQAEGLTAAELADVIHRKLTEFIQEPQVSVIVTQVNAPKIFVLGSVVRPGPYPLRSDTSVLQALSLAGGFTEFASPKKIKIVRSNGAFQETRTVNYYDMIDEGAGNYLLRPGDTIVVP